MQLCAKRVTVCLFVLLLPSILIAATRTVPSPYPTIQSAINASVDGDTIIVLPGTYYENISFRGKNIILTSTDPENSDIVAATIIDGRSRGRVVTFDGSETPDCVLQGFTITNGLATGSYPDSYGGGVLGSETQATIIHCHITGNTASFGGGLYDCNGAITHCTITGNTAEYYGGGLYFCDGSIVNCTITSNTAGDDGGGLCYCDGSIVNCTITSNTAGYGGGGLSYCDGSIVNCTITGNAAEYYGGGLRNCDGEIANCTITGNTVVGAYGQGGGLVYCDGPITHCTITGNMTDGSGDGLAYCDGPITNCIIWSNQASGPADQLYDCSLPTYTCIQGWSGGGAGNTAGNPNFVDVSSSDPANWDLHLLPGSPCIDAGTNTPQGGLPTTDIEGNLRPYDGDLDGTPVADMGAYEFYQFPEEAYLFVAPGPLVFSAPEAADNPIDQTTIIKNYGNQTSNWSADLTGKPDWLTVTPTGGSLELGESESVTLSVDTAGLADGQYSYSFGVIDPAAENSPQTVTVQLSIGDIYVPGQYPTIQSAIDAAFEGDTIIVSPGTYYENIHFNSKNIILTSTDPENLNIVAETIIDGGSNGRVVTFAGSETPDCVLRGFTITNGLATGSYPDSSGGGVLGSGTETTIIHCQITGNTAGDYGGGLSDCRGRITHCTITGNTAGDNGGGLSHCDSEIINCMITGNSAGRNGGGLYNCDGPITDCTVMGNTATSGRGLRNCDGTITNCIIWDNGENGQGDQLYYSSIPTYSCIQSWAGGGTGNISSDPLFVDTSGADPTNWDLHLLPGSPCIDAGTNTPPGGLPATDIEGFFRPYDGDLDGTPVTDMGAYEFYQFPEEAYLFVPSGTLVFSALEAADNPIDQTTIIKNYGNQTSNWSADLTGKPDWLTVTPTGGSLELGESESVTLSVDITGLSEGQYSFSFQVIDPAATNSPQTVTVDLEVTGAILEVSSNTFWFGANEAGADPNDQVLAISNLGGGVLDWFIVDPNQTSLSLPAWLTVAPTGGSLELGESESVTLSVDTAGLADGQYSYSIDVIDPAAENSPQTVTVYLGIGDIYVPGQYPNIQSAIDAVVEGDTIIVLPGTYYENISFRGKNIILTSTDPEDPNVVASTIIDGGGKGRVVTFSGSEKSDCVIRGFTITSGDSTSGGGVLGNGAQITIEHCTITGNTAEYNGGGLIYCDGSIINCTITGNTAEYYNGGGLIYCDGSIINCTITGNRANDDGGGLSYCDGSIINCTITGNKVSSRGGGLYDCDGSIINCTITGNTAGGGGGLSKCNGQITHCTITGNTASLWGGGLYYCNGPITHCIIWDNDAGIQNDQLYDSSTPTFSCVQDWSGGGAGNITSDPLFADVANGDYHLKSQYGRWDSFINQWVYDTMTSSCIDAGDPALAQWQNELWPHGGRVNMGAYGGTAQASMSANPIGNVADLDHDDIVGAIDLLLLSEDWLYQESLLDTDLTRDGRVDIADFAELGYQWLWEFRPVLTVSDRVFSPVAFEAGSNPGPNLLTITNTGGRMLNWTIDDTGFPDWLTMTPTSGALAGSENEDVTLSVDITGLSGGQYSYTFEVSDPAADNSPQSVTVDLTIGVDGDFESDWGIWANVSGADSDDWSRNSGGTATYNTGPSSGANGTTYYAYLETSGGQATMSGDSAVLESVNIPDGNRTLSFYYHMYGADMGTLNVDLFHGGAWIPGIWSRSGQQHASHSAPYTQAMVDLSGYAGVIKLRFRGVAAGGINGDMAIDEIQILFDE